MYYGPKRKKNGRFDFTYTDTEYNPPRTEPIGFCKEHWNEGNRDGHHASAREAVGCYLKYLLEVGIEYGHFNITLLPCAICGTKTLMCAASNQKPFLSLCSAHCNEKSLREFLDRNLAFEVIEEAHEHPSSPIIIPESVR